jgi:hypothetical protein
MKEQARKKLLIEAKRLRQHAQKLLNRAERLETQAESEPVDIVVKKTTVQMWLMEPQEFVELYGSEDFSRGSKGQFRRSLRKLPPGVNFSEAQRIDFLIEILCCIEEKEDREPYKKLLHYIEVYTGLNIS